MRRRDFITLLGGAAVALPLAAGAQQTGMPVIGYLAAGWRLDEALMAAFLHGLNEEGYTEGRDVAIEYRWAEGQYDRLPTLAAEFVNRPVAIIAAAALPAALAAKAATSTLPIVFLMGADPVQLGVVASLNRPGGNVTGVYQFFGALGGKRLELAREIVPTASTIAVLVNPSNPNKAAHLGEIQSAARATGQRIEVLEASSESEIDAAFATLTQRRAGALIVADDPFFGIGTQLVRLAARHRVPAIYYARVLVTAGGLISYGPSQAETYRQFGIYAGRVLKGAKPSDLPIVQPTKFELVINLKTAKALGLTIPPSLLARADEVIE
jgi:putative tryptophan/tyrosine transport system substrate-binding protein